MISQLRLTTSLLLTLTLLQLSPLRGGEFADVKTTTNLLYRDIDPEQNPELARCMLDIYAPNEVSGLPCLVWFYGGGLEKGNRGAAAEVAIAKALASEGMVVAMVDYRLSPKAQYPAYIEDAAAAVAWVKANAEVYGGDPTKLFVAGHSAGGYLAAMVGLDAKYLGKFGVKITDITGIIPISGQMITHSTVRKERDISRSTIMVDEAAPLYHASAKGTAAWLVFYATKDMPMRKEENELLVAALQAEGNKRVTLEAISDRDHASIATNVGKEGDIVRQKIVDFVKSTGSAPGN